MLFMSIPDFGSSFNINHYRELMENRYSLREHGLKKKQERCRGSIVKELEDNSKRKLRPFAAISDRSKWFWNAMNLS
jgi:hypothetical protein